MESLEVIIWKMLIEVLDTYIVSRYMGCFFQKKIVEKKILWLVYISHWGCMCLSTIRVSYICLNIVVSLSGLFAITLCYYASMKKRLIAALLIYFMAFLAEGMVSVLADVENQYLFQKIKIDDMKAILLIKLIFGSGVLFVRRFKSLKSEILFSRIYIEVVLLIVGCSLWAQTVFVGQANANKTLWGMLMFYMSIMGAVLCFLYDIFAKLISEKQRQEELKREKSYYKGQVEILQRQEMEQRQFRHDIKNHLIFLEQMACKGQKEEIQKYLKYYKKKFEVLENICETGNIVVDSVCNYKLAQIRGEGVQVKVNITVPTRLKIEDDDLVIILGNLLDNAIEAVGRKQENKKIEMELYYEKGSICLSIKNTYDFLIKNEKGKLITQKKDKSRHGIGLKNVERIVKQYGGNLKIDYDNEVFCVDIYIPGV